MFAMKSLLAQYFVQLYFLDEFSYGIRYRVALYIFCRNNFVVGTFSLTYIKLIIFSIDTDSKLALFENEGKCSTKFYKSFFTVVYVSNDFKLIILTVSWNLSHLGSTRRLDCNPFAERA